MQRQAQTHRGRGGGAWGVRAELHGGAELACSTLCGAVAGGIGLPPQRGGRARNSKNI
jgi:hypothetical protein